MVELSRTTFIYSLQRIASINSILLFYNLLFKSYCVFPFGFLNFFCIRASVIPSAHRLHLRAKTSNLSMLQEHLRTKDQERIHEGALI